MNCLKSISEFFCCFLRMSAFISLQLCHSLINSCKHFQEDISKTYREFQGIVHMKIIDISEEQVRRKVFLYPSSKKFHF